MTALLWGVGIVPLAEAYLLLASLYQRELVVRSGVKVYHFLVMFVYRRFGLRTFWRTTLRTVRKFGSRTLKRIDSNYSTVATAVAATTDATAATTAQFICGVLDSAARWHATVHVTAKELFSLAC